MHMVARLTLVLFAVGAIGCSHMPVPPLAGQEAAGEAEASKDAPLPSGLSADFKTWLNAHGYAADDFSRDKLKGGSYGGRTAPDEPVTHDPVIFIHGNTDKAIGPGLPLQTGWTNSIRHFLDEGYRPSELYAITWGSANPKDGLTLYHSKAHLTRVRRFIEAVLAYTGAKKVDIISHSMGVTLARKAIKGGSGIDLLAGGRYDLGKPLTGSVDTFVGIAGGNWGLVNCVSTPDIPVCGATNGVYPGTARGVGLSRFLVDLNATKHYEGAHVYSIWSRLDELIGYGNMVYGRYTSRIPGQDGEKVYARPPYGHFNTKNKTARVQLRMVRDHVIDD